MSNSTAAVLVVAALALTVSRSANGSDSSGAPASVGLVARGCGADLREVRELSDLLGVELAPVRIEARNTPPLVEISTTCTAVESVTFRDGDSVRTRPVSLEDVAPELRPVALAVLTAEFLRSIWATPRSSGDTVTPAPPAPAEAASASSAPETATQTTLGSPRRGTAVQAPVPTEPPSPPSGAPRATPAKDHAGRKPGPSKGLRLGAGVLLRYFANPGTFLGGGELSLAGPLLFVSANAAVGSEQDPLGQVSVGVVSATLGGRLKFAQSNQVTWWGTAAADLGWSWATAIPIDPQLFPRSAGAVFAALTLGPELDVPIGGAFGLTLGIRAGAARGVVATADHRQVAGTQGFTVASSAIIHFAL